MQEQYGYKMPDIMKMSKLEFQAFIDSISVKKTKEEPKVMKIDEAFPQFFRDPFAKRGDNK